MKKKNDSITIIPVLILYSVVFYSLWTVWELWAKPFINVSVENEYISQLIKSGVVKNLVWTLPALLLVNHFKAEMYVGVKEMFTAKVSILKYLPIYLAFTVYLLGGAFLQKGGLAISETFGVDKLITVLFVGITEESVFRGWLLNALIDEKKKWVSVLVTSVMFLLIHFPIWIHDGVFVENFMSFGFLSPLAVGIICGWTFIKSQSLWIPISLHMYWDLMIFLFY